MSERSPAANCGRCFAFTAALVVTLSLSSAVYAQIDTQGNSGNGGRNIITGNIFLPGGRRLERRAKVTLKSIGYGEEFMFSNDNGSFTFRSLREGTYTVTIDAGEEFQVATETVDIIQPSTRLETVYGDTNTINIVLKPRPDKMQPLGTVNASAPRIPDEAVKRYAKAQQLAKDGKTDAAIGELKKALQTCPTFAAALNELGLDYLKKRQIPDAQEAFKSALKLAPEEFTPRLNYGIALVEAKDYKAGEEQLRLALQKDGSSASAHLYLGRSMVELFEYDAAEKELRKAIDIGGPEITEAHRYLAAVYIEKHQPGQAADELEKYLALNPKVKDAARIKAVIAKLRGGV